MIRLEEIASFKTHVPVQDIYGKNLGTFNATLKIISGREIESLAKKSDRAFVEAVVQDYDGLQLGTEALSMASHGTDPLTDNLLLSTAIIEHYTRTLVARGGNLDEARAKNSRSSAAGSVGRVKAPSKSRRAAKT